MNDDDEIVFIMVMMTLCELGVINRAEYRVIDRASYRRIKR